MTWRDLAARIELREGREWVSVPVDDWRAVHLGLREAGRVRLEHLAGYDDGGVILVSTLADAEAGAIVHVTCGPSDDFAAIDDVYPTASWHQREVAQMLGVVFTGAADSREAFEGAIEGHPLRRDSVLEPRLARPWPGAFEPDESARRRPSPPPGVTPEWSR